MVQIGKKTFGRRKEGGAQKKRTSDNNSDSKEQLE